ncbi:MAG: FtsW/RodA/SpoVE family cell cycle protein [Saprospiraceae bacterium]|nr:FtsW/RodA/SpoVE family cell cycle protein [Saprospiraceae bacterium]
MSRFFASIKGDKVIWIVVILLSVFSLLAVYSSTGTLAYKYKSGNTEFYLIKHFMILVFGFVLMYLAHLVRYTLFSRISQIALIVAIPLLFITLISGTNVNDAARWLTLPVINITFQTSDLAKLALIMYVARLLSKKQEQIKDLKSAFVPIMIPILITCGLILPANFSTAAVLFATSVVLMFIGRVSIKYIAYLIGIGIAALLLLVLVAKYYPNLLPRLETWVTRVESFSESDSESNYQVEQAKIAIASGGTFGKMPGNSTQRNFLPSPFADFIFAIIIEEYGLIGGVFILLLYLILLFRGLKIVSKSPGTFGAFLAIGLSFSLVFQAMINMAVAVNLFPVTGQALPLVSMGGTSIWFTSLAIGIILSVSKETEGEEDAVDEKVNA